MKEDLKPCPFCGNRDLTASFTPYDLWIECVVCDVIMHGNSFKEKPKDLVERWNKRKPS